MFLSATDLTLGGLVAIVQDGGWVAVPSILIFIIFTGLRGDWRSKREYLDLVKDRNEWKEIATTATNTAKEQNEQIGRLTGIIETFTTKQPPRGRGQ